MSQSLTIKIAAKAERYDVSIGHGLIAGLGSVVRQSAGLAGKVAIVSNPTVFDLYGRKAVKSLRAEGFTPIVHLIGDGERFKNLKTLQGILETLNNQRLKRTDVVVSLGGGVVGDIAAFAASIHLRGVPLVQMPTTLLSMIDSSVGGKTGVNTAQGKNLVGSFYQPSAVIVDPDVLATLPQRELTAGFCEAVKHGALSGTRLLMLTDEALEHRESFEKFTQFLAEQLRFKASIVTADPYESAGRSDERSRKILNLGHTFGHALERVTRFRRFKHGEAVGHGLIFVAGLSKKLELMAADEVKLLNDVVHRTGNLPTLRGIDPSKILETFAFDKKNVGSSLQWVLLKGIGKPVIAGGDDVPKLAVRELLTRTLSA